MAARGRSGVLALSLLCAGCGSQEAGSAPAEPPSEDARVLAELRRFEGERRAAADFASMPASDQALGADPYVIRPVSMDRYVGVLRGSGAVVLLDAELRELARVEAPPSPSGLALRGDVAFVVGERAQEIRRYQVGRDRLAPLPSIDLGDRRARALRDVAVGPEGALHAVEEERGRLISLVPNEAAQGGYDVSERTVGAGAFRVARTKSAVVVDCLIDHTVVSYRVDARGAPTGEPAVIRNDGPLWSMSAIEEEGGLLVATGGVEDRPLDRTHGSFENIDSFVYLDRVAWEPSPRAERVASVNVSEHGVVTPKAIDLRRGDAGLWITATGYGGERFASIHVPDRGAPPEVISHALPPGTSMFSFREDGEMLIANPLLDAWIWYRTEHLPGLTARVEGPGDEARSAASRLGELLVFTSLMAPWQSSEGPLSRFTCETCHFEGYGDGRAHATGRGDVRATTKPLLGLFNNRPHFSRALDPDLSSVAHNEFRVAGARSGHDPMFDLRPGERPWVDDLGVVAEDLSAVALRRAFMAFLMDFTPRASAMTAGQRAYSAEERKGAEVFRDRCEGCHEARLSTDVPGSRAPFEGWEAKILSEAAPVVWAQGRYEKTGVLPYVHELGARVPSLRRLYKKQPYFTNGSARSVGDVLVRARWGEGVFFHDGAPADAELQALSHEDRSALEAFLRLL